MTAGYSGKPLTAKLGVRPDSRVLVSGAPDGFVLDCPHDVRASGDRYDVILLFCPDLDTLEREYDAGYRGLTVAGALWVAWPKKASGIVTDINEHAVRNHGLTNGLVDVKVAAIDDTWSGLKFVRRKADR